MASLAPTFGRGAMTNHWVDIKNADLVLIMGGNAAGQVVNRWTSTGMLCASASSNESGYITHKVMRSMGLLVFDNQARV